MVLKFLGIPLKQIRGLLEADSNLTVALQRQQDLEERARLREQRKQPCGAKTRTGRPCRRKGLCKGGRCANHGGESTGPRTEDGKQRISTAPHRLDADSGVHPAGRDSVVIQPWGPWRWPLMLTTPERAILELLDELPDNESFHQVDVLMEGLSTLSPARLQTLLVDCRSIKVKRLFFFFADRHRHAWLKRLNRRAIDLGSGKRMLVKGGRFDAQHLITVPESLDGVP